MTQDEIIEMARKAGFFEDCGDGQGGWLSNNKNLEAFAKLVAAKEREECAKACEDIFYAPEPKGCGGDDYYYTRPYLHCAETIRARGQE